MFASQSYYLLAFFTYLLIMILISWLVSRKQKNASDYLLAGRKVPLFLTLGTTVATMVGTGSSMGAVGFAYENGWAGALYGVGGAVGILLLAWLFAPARDQVFSTMSEELASYVGNHKWVKQILAVVIYAASIGWLGAHLIGGGMYLSWLTELSITQAKLLIGAGLAVFIILGGYSAVVWTDSLQAIILFIGFVLMAYFSLENVGGLSTLNNSELVAKQGVFSYKNVGLLPAISMFLAVLVGVLATPSFRQRIYAADSVKTIRRSFILSGILYLFFALLPALIGTSAYLMNSALDSAAYAFPYIALHVLPVYLGGFILLAGISATLSSASSDAIAGVSVLISDIFSKAHSDVHSEAKQLLFSRLAMLGTIIIALLLALWSDDIVSYITKMISILMSGLCVMGILGRFWSDYTWQGATATLLGGALAGVLVGVNHQWALFFGNPIIPSCLTALLLGIAISFLTKGRETVYSQCQENERLQ
ncbi:sodium:solute symporter family protein [Pseudoalteromonas sp. H105]|uniref:sodium:solute symporter family protein n=1 Tax=Pseudoalteromonas sp. H105 TaxID=1348393 RepID=UPI00073203D9|nr:sodium:solute symporter family protein [Pseudoalteromonas sp. H105]KTF16806.1 sodium:proline symporter [Pseudoalteromonas sp. H105]